MAWSSLIPCENFAGPGDNIIILILSYILIPFSPQILSPPTPSSMLHYDPNVLVPARSGKCCGIHRSSLEPIKGSLESELSPCSVKIPSSVCVSM